jgi:hypothetical protein
MTEKNPIGFPHHIHHGDRSKISLAEEARQREFHVSERYHALYKLFHRTITPNWDWQESEQF